MYVPFACGACAYSKATCARACGDTTCAIGLYGNATCGGAACARPCSEAKWAQPRVPNTHGTHGGEPSYSRKPPFARLDISQGRRAGRDLAAARGTRAAWPHSQQAEVHARQHDHQGGEALPAAELLFVRGEAAVHHRGLVMGRVSKEEKNRHCMRH